MNLGPLAQLQDVTIKKIVTFTDGVTFVLEPHLEEFIKYVLMRTQDTEHGPCKIACIKFLRAEFKDDLNLSKAKQIVDWIYENWNSNRI